MKKILFGKEKWVMLNGRRVRAIVPPKKPTITWEDVVKTFRGEKKE